MVPNQFVAIWNKHWNVNIVCCNKQASNEWLYLQMKSDTIPLGLGCIWNVSGVKLTPGHKIYVFYLLLFLSINANNITILCSYLFLSFLTDANITFCEVNINWIKFVLYTITLYRWHWFNLCWINLTPGGITEHIFSDCIILGLLVFNVKPQTNCPNGYQIPHQCPCFPISVTCTSLSVKWRYRIEGGVLMGSYSLWCGLLCTTLEYMYISWLAPEKVQYCPLHPQMCDRCHLPYYMHTLPILLAV